jgi:AcrR family transcriptional regulator
MPLLALLPLSVVLSTGGMVRGSGAGCESPVRAPDTADRLRDAAFDLFAVQGLDATTVDDIAQRAGVGRTTFFRHFRAKEDVVFPDHAALAAAVAARLEDDPGESPLAAVTEAALVVLRRYVGEGDRARARYRLVTSIEPLRARELASTEPYQRAFRRYLRRHPVGDQGGAGPSGSLHADILAAAVIAAHNHVLRRWLRGDSPDPEHELRTVLAEVFGRWAGPTTFIRPSPRSTVVVLESDLSPEAAAAAVQEVLTGRSAAGSRA